MKLMKAMKKLKFWSKNKKKKKKDHYYHQYQKLPHYNFQPCYNTQPPPPRLPLSQNCQCHFCYPAEPSAPPLPPWLDEGIISGNLKYVNLSNDHEMGDQCISVMSQETLIISANANTSSEDCSSNRTVGPTSRQGSPSNISDIRSSNQLQETAIRKANTTTISAGSGEPTSSDRVMSDIISSSSQLQETVIRTASTRTNAASSKCTASQQLLPNTENAAVNAAGGLRLFGCVVDVGGLLLRCFFPCFHISDPHSSRVSDKALADHIIEKKGY